MKKENKIKLKEKNKKFIEEFKEFIARGNVMDLAVGVIVGAAFGKIVTSLTDNILMPIIGILIGGFDFTKLSLKINIWSRTIELKYGIFLQNTVDFLITAFCIFIIIKIVNKIFRKKEEQKEEAKEEQPVAKSEEVLLLEEIRDLLKENKKNAK